MAGFVGVAKIGELAPGTMKLVEMENRDVVLINLGGEFYAIDNECPHAGCDLVDGNLDGTLLECDCHGSSFNVMTGSVQNPPAEEPVKTYPVRIEGDNVLVNSDQ